MKPEDFLTRKSVVELETNSEEETFAVGRRIAESLTAGMVVALRGTLGSGKTCLAKGIAGGLKIKENVTSPTYTIINEYDTTPPLFHIDAYRLNNDEDFEQIGGRELIGGGGIYVIEWSERIAKSLPSDAVAVELEITGSSSRLIRVSGLELK